MTATTTHPNPSSLLPLSLFLAVHGTAVGVLWPYIPAYYQSLGMTAAQVGMLGALSPLCLLFGPAWWGHVADRTGRPDQVLRWLYVGSIASFLPMLVLKGFWAVFLTMGGFVFFFSSLSPISDGMALQAAGGTGYGKVRLFASVGYVLSSIGFGLLSLKDPRFIITVPLALMVLAGLAARNVDAVARSAPERRLWDGLELFKDRELLLLCVASCLHWMAHMPFNGFLALHVKALGMPTWVVGVGTGLGAAAEISVMALYGRLARYASPKALLYWAFVVGALRWTLTSWVTDPFVLVSLSLLHAMTFGAFFMSAMAILAKRVPASMRATGTALYFACAFGISGVLGSPLIGWLWDRVGGAKVFGWAAGVELVASGIVLAMRRRESVAPSGLSTSGAI